MRVTVYLSRSSVASDDDDAMGGAACALAAAAVAVDVSDDAGDAQCGSLHWLQQTRSVSFFKASSHLPSPAAPQPSPPPSPPSCTSPSVCFRLP